MGVRRQVIQQGASTLMISLPAGWARRHNIRKGAEVELEEAKDHLTVLPTADAATSRIEIDLTGMATPILKLLESLDSAKRKRTYADPQTHNTVRSAMVRLFAALYKAGYDEIRLTFEHPGTIGIIQQALVQELSEYEIVEQGQHHCLLQDISGVLKERFEPAVRRIFFLLLQMAEEGLPPLRDGDVEALRPLRFLEESNNRFTTFCRRLLSKKGYKDPERLQFIYLLVDRLELLADQYKYLFDWHIAHPTARLSKETLALYARTAAYLRELMEFYASHDRDRIVKLQALREGIIDDALARLPKATAQEFPALHLVLTVTQLAFESVEAVIALQP